MAVSTCTPTLQSLSLEPTFTPTLQNMHTDTTEPIFRAYIHTDTTEPIFRAYIHTDTTQPIFRAYIPTDSIQPYLNTDTNIPLAPWIRVVQCLELGLLKCCSETFHSFPSLSRKVQWHTNYVTSAYFLVLPDLSLPCHLPFDIQTQSEPLVGGGTVLCLMAFRRVVDSR